VKEMITDKTFRITYMPKKIEGVLNTKQTSITRFGKWVEGCKYWTDKSGKAICTYWDIDADNYRNATTSWTMKV
jgi:hypothetical protein